MKYIISLFITLHFLITPLNANVSKKAIHEHLITVIENIIMRTVKNQEYPEEIIDKYLESVIPPKQKSRKDSLLHWLENDDIRKVYVIFKCESQVRRIILFKFEYSYPLWSYVFPFWYSATVDAPNYGSFKKRYKQLPKIENLEMDMVVQVKGDADNLGWRSTSEPDTEIFKKCEKFKDVIKSTDTTIDGVLYFGLKVDIK